MPFLALAEFLRDTTETLLERWRSLACRDPAQPACRHKLTGAELDDHLPSLVRLLAAGLVEGSTESIEREGREHGHQRRAHAYTVTEIVEEMNLFRGVVLGAVDDYGRADPATRTLEHLVAARSRLLQLIDRSVCASVEQCFRESEAARIAAERRLEEKNAALEEADAQKDRFLTMLSHELRNPLSPILSAVHLIQRLGPKDALLEKQRAIIERQVRHLTKLIEDLLDVHRLSNAKIELRPMVLELQEAVGLAIESCRPRIEASEIDLGIETSNEPLRVFADPTRLAQVATNLIDNAAKFTAPGGSIHVRVARENGEAVLRVRDTGIGISADMLPRIFDAFVQADSSLDRRRGGLGIGLMVAKNLVEMHGGRIEVRSEGLGHGAEFTVRLPLALKVPAASSPEPVESRGSAAAPTERARRIALVEDNDDAREALAAALEIHGHEILPAAGAETALALCAAATPDVFIIDIGLPGMNGLDLARALRREPCGSAALLIALSGYGTEQDKSSALAAGFDAHLTKPAEVAEIERLLRQPRPNARQ